MLNHDVKSICAGVLAKFCPHSDIPTNNHLQARADGREDVSRADYDSANNAKILCDAEVWQFKRSSYHLMRNRITRRTNRIGRSLVDGISVHVGSFATRI